MIVLVGKKVIISFLCTWTESHQSKLSPVLTSLKILISFLAKVLLSVMSQHQLLETACLLSHWNFNDYALKFYSCMEKWPACTIKTYFCLHRSINIALNSLPRIQILLSLLLCLSPKIFKFEKQYVKKRTPTPSTIFQLNSWERMKSNL